MVPPKPGDRLNARKASEQTHEVKRELARLGIDRSCIVYATFVDATGVSVHAKRDPRRGDVQAFIPSGQFDNWASYFEVGAPPNMGFRGTKHFTRRFPRECA